MNSTDNWDRDPVETDEWIESLEAVVQSAGSKRAGFLLSQLWHHAARKRWVEIESPLTPYVNTIPPREQPPYPGCLRIEKRIAAYVRWNAVVMVTKANLANGELGGHLASYASAAEIFEMGFNHFFRGPGAEQGGDLVFYQPHSSPGVYARSFLEGRLGQLNLGLYRKELTKGGLSSYPHPWLMPDYWQFPTGSMGLGPINAVYQARFLRYLHQRGVCATDARHVWGIFGDGEMDEPESLAALALAAREKLCNLTFVINCNLQRLDGPVRGNQQIITELERVFRGAGWNVIKVLWGRDWDDLFERDESHALERLLGRTVDGEFQTLGANSGGFNRAHFFEQSAEVSKLVSGLSNDRLEGLTRGGHDFVKLFAAFDAATRFADGPTVILAKTKKGFGLGAAAESKMTAHQYKKAQKDVLLEFRERFDLAVSDADVESLQFVRPDEGSEEYEYLRLCRARLGGSIPQRSVAAPKSKSPRVEEFAKFVLSGAERSYSTTMGFGRILSGLLRIPAISRLIVPIVADEARTFGLAPLFRKIGIYASAGQRYQPEDHESLLSYIERSDGQLLEEGISEAGALASWTAAATSYSVSGIRMLPFYIFYSMFGFQRVGDLIWAAADQRARGFLIGATAGRTTLGGEGLQHQDGSSHLVATTVPNCKAYDPSSTAELAVIIEHGCRTILESEEDIFYYVTVTNENYRQIPLDPSTRDDIIRGMYLLGTYSAENSVGKVRLLGSGSLLMEAVEAAEMLRADWRVQSEVWSVTSFGELERQARAVNRENRLNPAAPPGQSYVSQCLPGTAPVIAVTDYVSAYANLIGGYVEAAFTSLGTDGFGRSDTRADLRCYFEVDRFHIVVAALAALAEQGRIARDDVLSAIERYGIEPDARPPWLA